MRRIDAKILHKSPQIPVTAKLPQDKGKRPDLGRFHMIMVPDRGVEPLLPP